MKFLVIGFSVILLFAFAWQHDAKQCRKNGWDFSIAGQCYDKDGYLRRP